MRRVGTIVPFTSIVGMSSRRDLLLAKGGDCRRTTRRLLSVKPRLVTVALNDSNMLITAASKGRRVEKFTARTISAAKTKSSF